MQNIFDSIMVTKVFLGGVFKDLIQISQNGHKINVQNPIPYLLLENYLLLRNYPVFIYYIFIPYIITNNLVDFVTIIYNFDLII